MCLLALALDQHRRFPLVIAANRDEFFDRPAQPLEWWSALEGAAPILSGRDLQDGGTWMGLNASGRLALLTNVRDGRRRDAAAPSRGRIVPDWLTGGERTDRFWMRTALSGYNGFNLIAADFQQGECFWATNSGAHPQRLGRGVYGLSNAALDTPWPKVEALKARLRAALGAADDVEALAQWLFAALADSRRAADADLPRTGIGIERERELSPAFIGTPDQRYGTRCSTLLISEHAGRHKLTHVIERSFDAGGTPTLSRRTVLKDWPHGKRDVPAPPVTEVVIAPVARQVSTV